MRKKASLCFCALTLLLLVINWRFDKYLNNGLTAEKLREQLATEIQPRTSRSQVEAWLDARKIEHKYYAKTFSYDHYGEHKKEESRVVIARADNTIRSFLVHGSTSITFFFDAKGKLLRHKTQDLLTGL